MSEKINVWNPQSRPVRVSTSGALLGGMRRGQVDPTDPVAAEAIKKGFIIQLADKKKVVPAPAQPVVELPQVEEQPPAETVVEEAAAVIEAPIEEAAPVAEQAEDAAEDKPAKTTRSKSQTASKEF